MLKEHHVMLRNAVEEIVEREISSQAAWIDSEDAFPVDALNALKQVGLLGLLLPEAHGGGGQDLLSFVLGVEAIAAVSPSTAWACVVHASASLGIAAAGDQKQQEKFLPPLAAGNQLATFAFTEAGAGADFNAIETNVALGTEAYVLNGRKDFISLAGEAHVYIVLARTPREDGSSGLSMLLVEKETRGFSIGSRRTGLGMRGISWGELVFDECQVPQENLLGEFGQGMRVLFGMAGTYLLGAAALALGIAQGTFAETVRHLRERKVRDQPLGNLEALQFRLADMGAKVEAIRSLVYRACLDENPRSHLPFEAKLFASETTLDIVRLAMQLCGATGYSQDSPVQRLLRDAFAVPLHFENNDFLRRFLGRTLAGL